ncbi:hypothetical protein HPC49_04580 [Pyxidicoccus fallax]|uniref:Lipoprotein n=1 Tax=Pyxidicoccus fallax TaxID=394095 RepID=A0A848LGF1_9BACT|nr:hypothetical protein [Pyxidicoccus fallax]NMO16345.1 hypothetical protein [Pyxidicoccus fallax]NPC77526.1 hypothetical protein [Pyxidicoccus fallax]
MRARAWWLVATVGIAGCGGLPEDTAPEPEEEELGTLRQAEATGPVAWVRFGRSEGEELGSAVAQDRDGNVLTTVVFSGGTDLGTGPLGSGDPEVPGLVLAKHSPGGRLLWTRVFQGRAGGLLAVDALGTDRERNVLFAGWSEAGADLRAGELAPPVTLEGAFIGKLDRDGRLLWVKTLAGDAAFLANGVVTDRAGNVFVSGSVYEGSLDLGGRVLTATGLRAFVAKYGADGTLKWLYAAGESTQAGGVALDEVGDAYFCGTAPDEGGTGTRTRLWRLDSASGAVVWTNGLDDGDCTGVAVHGNRVVMTGSFLESFTFGGRTYRASETPGVMDSDAFVVAYTLAGEERWARNFARVGTGVAMDQDDGVLVTGHYESGNRVGGAVLPGVPGSIDNLFVMKLDRIDGAPRWVRGLPSTAALALDVSVSREGEGVLVGAFGGPTDFGGGSVSPAGNYDAFILRLGE